MECSSINQNIESQSAVFLLCEIIQFMHKLIFLCENKTKQSCFPVKPLLHVKHDCSMQLLKQHDNLQKFPNAASITRGGLDKTLAVPVIIFVLTAEWDQ